MNTSEGQQISVEEEQEPLEGKGKEPERPKANLKRSGRHKDDIWSYFEEKGERNRDIVMRYVFFVIGNKK